VRRRRDFGELNLGIRVCVLVLICVTSGLFRWLTWRDVFPGNGTVNINLESLFFLHASNISSLSSLSYRGRGHFKYSPTSPLPVDEGTDHDTTPTGPSGREKQKTRQKQLLTHEPRIVPPLKCIFLDP
jgi:hypothetical protein